MQSLLHVPSSNPVRPLLARSQGGNSGAENRPRIPVGTVAPHSGPRRESATIVAACDEVARQPTGGGFPAGTALLVGGTLVSGLAGGACWLMREVALSGRVSRFARDAGRRPAFRGRGCHLL